MNKIVEFIGWLFGNKLNNQNNELASRSYLLWKSRVKRISSCHNISVSLPSQQEALDILADSQYISSRE